MTKLRNLFTKLSSIVIFLPMTSLFQAGALLACGIVNVGVRNECDPALALLSDYILHPSNTMRIGAVIG